VPGVEVHDEVDGQPRCTRAVRLAHGPGLLRLTWTGRDLLLAFAGDPADADDARLRAARLADVAVDPGAVRAHLGADPHLAGLVATSPGLRIPGSPDPAEVAFSVLVSQQVSVKAAARCGQKIAERYGERLATEAGPYTVFPTAATLAEADPAELPMPRARGRALVGLAGAIASGALVLSPDRPWAETRAGLLAQPGIGPWTADAIGLRALGQTDILLDTDLVIRRELAARGVTDPGRWSPYRSYATLLLWRAYV
jgi:3-methyladenine DNA glycosylase/8-oxoguanine DNA glycosylase